MSSGKGEGFRDCVLRPFLWRGVCKRLGWVFVIGWAARRLCVVFDIVAMFRFRVA